jgi:glycosyltransferase involved in cell wall biosynthesis
VNGQPQVSVIMPSYNTAHLIAASLDSVLRQSFNDFEIIVVNDGSPDTIKLEKALAPYLSRIIYVEQENKGAGGARNTAIARARGEFLAFLDSDDAWLPDHLTSQMKQFEENPALDLVYCNCLLMKDQAHPQEFMERCPSHGAATFLALVTESCQIPVTTVVARKNALLKAGLFDESLRRCEDYDMWLRVAFQGAQIGYTRRVQARLAHKRPGSLGESPARMAEAYWRILRKTEQSLPLSQAERDVVQKRAKQSHGLYLLEEGKLHLRRGQFHEARNMLAEANSYLGSYLRKSKIRLVLFGLSVAPNATSRLASWLERMRGD